jgi:hypothetical protein
VGFARISSHCDILPSIGVRNKGAAASYRRITSPRCITRKTPSHRKVCQFIRPYRRTCQSPHWFHLLGLPRQSSPSSVLLLGRPSICAFSSVHISSSRCCVLCENIVIRMVIPSEQQQRQCSFGVNVSQCRKPRRNTFYLREN